MCGLNLYWHMHYRYAHVKQESQVLLLPICTQSQTQYSVLNDYIERVVHTYDQNRFHCDRIMSWSESIYNVRSTKAYKCHINIFLYFSISTLWSVDYTLQTVDYTLQTVDYTLWYNRQFEVYNRPFGDYTLQTVDYTLHTVDYTVWSV